MQTKLKATTVVELLVAGILISFSTLFFFDSVFLFIQTEKKQFDYAGSLLQTIPIAVPQDTLATAEEEHFSREDDN